MWGDAELQYGDTIAAAASVQGPAYINILLSTNHSVDTHLLILHTFQTLQ